ncbi:MAG: hypothetical protein V4819_19340 [Verrucomicrobiota bacterium]
MNPEAKTTSQTRVLFDLADELSPEEIEKFEAGAKAAGKDITEHFLDLTLRVEPRKSA